MDGANKNGETPLHKAVREGNIEFLKLLLASKANVNALDRYKSRNDDFKFLFLDPALIHRF